jgi:hypothetical protein
MIATGRYKISRDTLKCQKKVYRIVFKREGKKKKRAANNCPSFPFENRPEALGLPLGIALSSVRRKS